MYDLEPNSRKSNVRNLTAARQGNSTANAAPAPHPDAS